MSDKLHAVRSDAAGQHRHVPGFKPLAIPAVIAATQMAKERPRPAQIRELPPALRNQLDLS